MSKDTALRRKLSRLNLEFRRQLSREAREVSLAWEEVRGTRAMASLEKLRFRAHTLAGAGGTFQCWEVSEAAAALDSELRALVRTGRKVDPRRIDRLGKFVRTLLDALDRAESGTGATGCSEA